MAEGEDPNAGGGGGDEDIEAKIAQAVEKAVVGLKENNGALKQEKTQLKEQFDTLQGLVESLGGADALKSLGNADTVKQLAEMRKRFEADENGKLLGEGKYDEWFDRRVGGLKKDYENQIAETAKRAEEAEKKSEGYLNAFRQKVLETEVASAAAGSGIESTALLDVQLRAQREFQFDAERNALVLRDQDGGVVFGKDGKSPKTVREWLDDQKEVSRHWWPPSKGGGAEGSERGGAGKDLGSLGFKEYQEQRKKDGFRPY